MQVPKFRYGLALLCLLAAGPALAQAWQGPYLGVHLGGAQTDFSDPAGDTAVALGGLQLGYNWQRGASVLGAEADITFPDISDRVAAGRYEEDLVTSLRLRAGLARGRTLYYGSLGVAWTGQEINLPGEGHVREFEPGVMLGGGAERFLRGNIAGRVEAYYVDSPTDTRTIGGTAVTTGSDSVLFRAGLSLHF